jgi:hypothetical protein
MLADRLREPRLLNRQVSNDIQVYQVYATTVPLQSLTCLRTFLSPFIMVHSMNIDGQDAAMARNKVQFQKGLSEAGFDALYGTEAKCRAVVIASRWPKGFECPASHEGILVKLLHR